MLSPPIVRPDSDEAPELAFSTTEPFLYREDEAPLYVPDQSS